MRIVNKQTKAFTMIELVFVIVVLGILAALALPRMDRDLRQEAADNVLSAIRYTQHLALNDDVTNPFESNWQRSFWRFGIEGCSDDGIFYYTGSDKSMEGNIGDSETAIDPANGKKMMGDNTNPCESSSNANASPNIFLTKKYGILDGDITFCSQSSPTHIGFDHFGRPHQSFTNSNSPNYASVLHSDCNITISSPAFDPDIIITIKKETGYAYIDGQDDS